jgi:calcineurin-like phosphoesterase family protein
VHGHVHNNVSALHFGPRYLNVSVEMTDYRPWSLDEVREQFMLRSRFAGTVCG